MRKPGLGWAIRAGASASEFEARARGVGVFGVLAGMEGVGRGLEDERIRRLIEIGKAGRGNGDLGCLSFSGGEGELGEALEFARRALDPAVGDGDIDLHDVGAFGLARICDVDRDGDGLVARRGCRVGKGELRVAEAPAEGESGGMAVSVELSLAMPEVVKGCYSLALDVDGKVKTANMDYANYPTG